MFWRRKKERDRLRTTAAAMSPQERREARSAAVFSQALRGRVHLMTMNPDIEYYYFELMRSVGESLGVSVAICPPPGPAHPDVPQQMGYEFRSAARNPTFDARVVIGWRYNFERHLLHPAIDLMQGTPKTATTIASGAIAMVEDDYNLFENNVRAIDRVRVTYALYDEVILLPFGSVTHWPTER